MKRLLFISLFLLTVFILNGQTPVITMVTNIGKENAFSFLVANNLEKGTFQVDWGDGTLVDYSLGSSYQEISGVLLSNTIKVYGSGILYLNVNSKELTSLDVSGATALTELYCSTNKLSKLDLSFNKELKVLNCSSNLLAKLDFTNNPNLKLLFCNNNDLTSIDISQNKLLTELYFASNPISKINLSNNTELITLYCPLNNLNSIDLSNNKALINLYCFSNLLKTLDVSNNTALNYLWCYSNKLTTLDVSKNLRLLNLNCSSNFLENIDVSNNSSLNSLSCFSNLLTFPTLPVKQSTWKIYSYSPQQNVVLPKATYTMGESIDLQKHLTSGLTATVFTWKTLSGSVLIAGEDYKEENGLFSFITIPVEEVYCQMTNASFPDLTLKTEKIEITSVTEVKEMSVKTVIYPNPVRDYINIESSDIIDKIVIFTSTGIKIAEYKTGGTKFYKLPAERFPKGLLIMKIYGYNNVSLNKILKE